MQTFKQLSFEVLGSEPTCVRIPIGNRGTINAIRIKQLSGDAVAATVNLYSSQAACAAAEDDVMISDGTLLSDPDLYKICPTITIEAGKLYEVYDKRYDYINTDSTTLNPARAIYLLIEPEGEGPQTWGITITYRVALTP